RKDLQEASGTRVVYSKTSESQPGEIFDDAPAAAKKRLEKALLPEKPAVLNTAATSVQDEYTRSVVAAGENITADPGKSPVNTANSTTAEQKDSGLVKELRVGKILGRTVPVTPVTT